MIFTATFNTVLGRNHTRTVRADSRKQAIDIIANKYNAADVERMQTRLDNGLLIRFIEPRPMLWEEGGRMVGQVDIVKSQGDFSLTPVYESGFEAAADIAMQAAKSGDTFPDYSAIRQHLLS